MPPKKKVAVEEKTTSSEEIFPDMVFAVVGSFDCSQAEIKKKIEGAGGDVCSSVTKRVTHVISTQDAVDAGKLDKNIDNVKVLSLDFIEESIKNGAKADEGKYKISKNSEATEKTASKRKAEDEEEEKEEKPTKRAASTRNKKTKVEKEEEEEEEEEEENVEKKPVKKSAAEKTEEKQNIKKVVYEKKGKAPVDSVCPSKGNYHVYESGSDIYDCMLNQTDITTGVKGNNKFYVIQLLESDSGGAYAVWNRWGRVGAVGQNKFETFGSSLSRAIGSFEKKFKDKTGNVWSNRKNFKKNSKKYDLIEMDYGDEVDDAEINAKLEEKNKKRAESTCKLDARVQELVKLLFDLNMFESTLVSMDLDIKKMPLGKISKTQIQKGFEILEELVTLFKKSDKPPKDKIAEICNSFYTKIPHDFGFQKGPLIDTKEALQQKLDLLETLADMEIAQQMLEKEKKDANEEHPIDAKFKLLKNDIVPLDKNGDEWKRIVNYIEKTQQNYKFELLDVFKLAREGEADNFKNFEEHEHRKLLWHGSKVAVFAAILSTGLKIMPHSGGRVGRGLYFADILAKSASYCGLHKDVGIVLLNEVVLGKIHNIQRDDSSLVKAPNGFQSVLAQGTQAPDSSAEYSDSKLSDSKHPVIIPQGDIKNTGIKSSFLHNEYLVYDAHQVNMKYLLMMKWKKGY